MGSYKVKRLNLPENVIDVLEKQNVYTCKDMLCLTIQELQSLFGISYEQALKLQVTASKKCVSEPRTVYDLLRTQRKEKRNAFLPSSLHSLDMLLRGGLLLGSVTEISGPPGVGKTQFCFMLCLLATLSTKLDGLDGQVIYIDTESAFSAERMKKMAKNRYPELYKTENDIQCLLQRIFVYKASSVYALKEIVPNIENEIIKKKIKLVIIDSIASLFRKEYGASVFQSVLERNNILLEQAAILKGIAQAYNIVVFLTNQITSQSADHDPTLSEYFSAEENKDPETEISSDFAESLQPKKKKSKQHQEINADFITPALGVTWSHCVNTRLVAQFCDFHVRQLIIAKSPVAPNASMKYILNETGLVLTDDDVEYVNMPNNEQKNLSTKYNFLTDEVTGTGNIFSKNPAIT